MPNVTADEINTQKHVRFFVQPGGSSPANPLHFSGTDNTYLNIEESNNPVRGGITPIRVHDPRRPGRYRNVGRTVEPPDFPSSTVQFMQKKDVLPRHLTTLPDCLAAIFMVVGDCRDLSDFQGGWSSYVKVYSNGLVTDVTEAGGSFDGDEALMDDLEYVWDAIYNIGKLGFSEKATTEVYSEVVDIVYGSRVQCGICGPADNGTSLIYALINNTVASPGSGPAVAYSLKGQNGPWTVTNINGAAAGDVPKAIDVVGQYLIAVFDNGTTGGYFYAQLNAITGMPGTWTKVTTSFVTAKAPQDVFVNTSREIWFAGKGGYVYKTDNILAGVTTIDAGNTTTQTLNRIHGLDEVIVAAGEGATLIYSLNRGNSFTLETNPPAGATNIDALSVNGDYLWWVGTDNGKVFYNDSQGENVWIELTFPGTPLLIQDIVFPTPEVGYLALTTSGPTAVFYTTFNGGKDWTNSSPRILNFPTLDRVNRIAAPEVDNANVAANNVALAGLAGNGTDGIILIGTAATL